MDQRARPRRVKARSTDMASRRKKQPAAGLSGNPDPRAPLDGAAFLDQARPLLKELAQDLLERADHSLALTEALQARHASERDAERTADAYPEWRRAFVEQVAAAWLLAAVFARTLEDRGLVGRNRLAGSGAQDSSRAFLELAPSLSEREYLLTVFRELSRLPAAAELFDTRHNPLWLLAPSAEGAHKLLELFRAPDSEAPTFRFGGDDTRFLGDLYQDVSEDVRKRYALLQTPRFIESFILDRTLEPAIERFGLNDTTLIDPTCGSGHFLLGAFERLFDHRLRNEPGLSPREAATKALDAIAGADINPYAIAIARFRLTLAFLEKCGINKLKDAPRLPLHLAVADSLLYNAELGQLALVAGTDPSRWEGSHFELEDPAAARDVLFKRYAVVVGNPPYITVKDPVLRERYRKNYVSAAGKYSLAAPFAERFFQLGRDGASVGMITANSFMKREFGKRLIEEYLPTINLELIVNTSGAYIPGHGTPTVLLFGTRETRKGSDVLCVLASRGEPATPEDAEKALVWTSIAGHWSEVGFENEYISVANVERDSLAKHPWSLGGGGASELKELLEERAELRLGALADTIGISCVTGEDEVYLLPADAAIRLQVGRTRPLVTGEYVRDWSLSPAGECVFPFSDDFLVLPAADLHSELRYLWPYRAALSKRRRFGVPMLERGLTWYELQELYAGKLRTPLTITFAFVATHNHFVLDRGGKVFKQSAPIIKLPETATEDDHLALLAYLNSSTAGFYFRQILHCKGGQGVNEGHKAEEWEQFLEYSGTQVGTLPLPKHWQSLASLGRIMLDLVGELEQSMPRAWIERWGRPDFGGHLPADISGTVPRDMQQRLVAMQEEIDWTVYGLFGLQDDTAQTEQEALRSAVFGALEAVDTRSSSQFPGELAAGHRPFELLMDRGSTQWFARNGYAEPTEPTACGPHVGALLTARMNAIGSNPDLRVLEQPQYKRRWTIRDVEREASTCVKEWALAGLERHLDGTTVVSGSSLLIAWLRSHSAHAAGAVHYLGSDLAGWVREQLLSEAVPFLAAFRHTESGLEKRAAWDRTWQLQRLEDAGEPTGKITVPSKYDQKDFRDPGFFRLRGKLDVPKERFISYPGCESDEDKEPVYGWAGWDHLQCAVALAGLYQDRKQREGWAKERLKPMLAGLLELLPWLKQWHHEPSADLGGERPSDQFEAFLNAECSEHGFTHDELRAWRPPSKKPSSKKPKKGKRAAVDDATADVD
jgi:hypothetical protein